VCDLDRRVEGGFVCGVALTVHHFEQIGMAIYDSKLKIVVHNAYFAKCHHTKNVGPVPTPTIVEPVDDAMPRVFKITQHSPHPLDKPKCVYFSGVL